MNKNNGEFWESIYDKGEQLNRYPFDSVVSFVMSNYPKNKRREDVRILELGCGAGNNLWFAAREGFDVTGIDISPSAIEYAKKRFEDDQLKGNFIVAGFDELYKLEGPFDLVIDRCSLTNVSIELAKKCITDIWGLLEYDGIIFFNGYSDRHGSCASGKYDSNGMVTDIKVKFSSITELFFYGRRDIYELFDENWEILSLQHSETTEQLDSRYFVYADWKVKAKKVVK